MLPTLMIFLAVSGLAIAGTIAFMLFDVMRKGPQQSTSPHSCRQWLPPASLNEDLEQWSEKVAMSVSRRMLTQKGEMLRPADLIVEIQQGTSVAVNYLPNSAHRVVTGPCPNRTSDALSATAPEILAIADSLRRDRTTENQVYRRAVQNLDEVGGQQAAAGQCPLLGSDGNCIAYSLRPVSCRTRCNVCGTSRHGFDSGEEAARKLGEGAERGLEKALAEAGLDGHVYELNAGLRVAMELPNASARWAAGEDLFAGCTRCEPGAAV